MKHIKSYPLYESAGIKAELRELIKNWVLGNEESYRFLPEHGDRLVELIDQNPWLREESRRHLAGTGVKRLWRGLHDQWEEEYTDQLGGSNFSSYSSSMDVASNFGSGDLLSIPVEEAIKHMLISIEWCAGWLGVEPFNQEEMQKFMDELDSGGINWDSDHDERWFRYMAWEQKEYLILNAEMDTTIEDRLNN